LEKKGRDFMVGGGVLEDTRIGDNGGKVSAAVSVTRDLLIDIWYGFHHVFWVPDWTPSSVSEQVARHLREGILQGRWTGRMPGRDRLAAELGVSPWSIQRGLEILEAEGALASRGGRRRRRIQGGLGEIKPRGFSIQILLYETSDLQRDYMVDLRHRLVEAGHEAEFAKRTLSDLRMDVGRVARLVEATPADGWIVVAGPQSVLEWFATLPTPTFALFGRRRALPIAGAGADKVPATKELVRRLVALGHRRIVLMAREDRRLPEPGAGERAFLDELAAHGIPTGDYHLPAWNGTPEGFLGCLDSLFELTPPTALVIDEAFLFQVAQQHLARRGILAPDHVSLAVCDPDPVFAWYRPQVAHLSWDPRPVVRQVVRWANDAARGVANRRQLLTRARLVDGGTIGPAPP
jgi:DNA-binding LacI/PurR family transcriptional regulator